MQKFVRYAAAAAAACLVPTAANAALVINIGQSGANVVATLSGTLSLAGLTNRGNVAYPAALINGSLGFISFSPSSTPATAFSGFTGPASWGSSSLSVGTVSAGSSLFAFSASSTAVLQVFLSSNFATGGALSGSDVWSGTTIAAMGLIPGTYVYTSSADTITVNIGNASSVPEPATWASMLAGFGLMGAALRRRARQRVLVRYR